MTFKRNIANLHRVNSVRSGMIASANFSITSYLRYCYLPFTRNCNCFNIIITTLPLWRSEKLLKIRLSDFKLSRKNWWHWWNKLILFTVADALKLTDGPHAWAGTVQLTKGGTDSQICHDNFGETEAKVIDKTKV